MYQEFPKIEQTACGVPFTSFKKPETKQTASGDSFPSSEKPDTEFKETYSLNS